VSYPPNSKLDLGDVALAVFILALLMGAYVGCAEVIHGDWRCAFAQCRIETK
jgi:hypothetical protein